MDDEIREVLDRHGRLAVPATTVDESDDLYRSGLTSHAVVNVMLALEDRFDVEFPDHLLRKQTFESVRSIREALLGLTGAEP